MPVGDLAATVLSGLQQRRSTWTRANVLAEAARATRHLRTRTPAERIELLDRVVEAALADCVPLDPPELFHTPARFRRAGGVSAFARPEEHAFTTEAVLAAEARLIAAAESTTAPGIPLEVVRALIKPMPGHRYTDDQAEAVEGITASSRDLDVLVGAAGTGKTRTLRALSNTWRFMHGPDSVVGLAPSAAAAAELTAALLVPCETTAKWLHENTGAPGCATGWQTGDGRCAQGNW